MAKKKINYDYNTFKELFDSHIHYAYEGQYGAHFGQVDSLSLDLNVEYVSFHKLTIFATGKLEYKGHWETYDPRLWPNVKALGEMLTETRAEKILYANKV